MKKLLLLLILLPALTAHAQNDKVLTQRPVVYSDRLQAQRIRVWPGYRRVFDETEVINIFL